MKKWLPIITFIVVIVVLDQLTKLGIRLNYQVGESTTVIDGLFNITYVRNPGAAFGFGAQSSDLFRGIMFLLLPVIACGWLVFLIKGSLGKDKLLTAAYSLILAGAIGNLIDRFALRYVVDFFDFYLGRSHFPAFNIADSAISIAAALLILDFILQLKNKKAEN